ncbi:carbon-nitrogen hydrolase family protein [Roseovarius aestuarii]|nr:carbon-nitrogen hydrolase family protein [Roseovarius aestuarii]
MTTPAPRVAAIQMRPISGDIAGNLDKIDMWVRAAAAIGVDMAILPENAVTGYFIADQLPDLAEAADGPSAKRLASLASECNLHLVAGTALAEGGNVYDAQLMFGPDGGLIATYRKAHLFSVERDWYAAGDAPMVVETALGRIGMTICYDLMFPEYIRRLTELGADIVINSTNWISDSFQHDVWGWSGESVLALARTRALENGVWLAMANCTGPEAGFTSLGQSCVVAPSGKVLAAAGNGEGIAHAEIQYQSDDLDRWRSIATYRQDRRLDLYR